MAQSLSDAKATHAQAIHSKFTRLSPRRSTRAAPRARPCAGDSFPPARRKRRTAMRVRPIARRSRYLLAETRPRLGELDLARMVIPLRILRRLLNTAERRGVCCTVNRSHKPEASDPRGAAGPYGPSGALGFGLGSPARAAGCGWLHYILGAATYRIPRSRATLGLTTRARTVD